MEVATDLDAEQTANVDQTLTILPALLRRIDNADIGLSDTKDAQLHGNFLALRNTADYLSMLILSDRVTFIPQFHPAKVKAYTWLGPCFGASVSGILVVEASSTLIMYLIGAIPSRVGLRPRLRHRISANTSRTPPQLVAVVEEPGVESIAHCTENCYDSYEIPIGELTALLATQHGPKLTVTAVRHVVSINAHVVVVVVEGFTGVTSSSISLFAIALQASPTEITLVSRFPLPNGVSAFAGGGHWLFGARESSGTVSSVFVELWDVGTGQRSHCIDVLKYHDRVASRQLATTSLADYRSGGAGPLLAHLAVSADLRQLALSLRNSHVAVVELDRYFRWFPDDALAPAGLDHSGPGGGDDSGDEDEDADEDGEGESSVSARAGSNWELVLGMPPFAPDPAAVVRDALTASSRLHWYERGPAPRHPTPIGPSAAHANLRPWAYTACRHFPTTAFAKLSDGASMSTGGDQSLPPTPPSPVLRATPPPTPSPAAGTGTPRGGGVIALPKVLGRDAAPIDALLVGSRAVLCVYGEGRSQFVVDSSTGRTGYHESPRAIVGVAGRPQPAWYYWDDGGGLGALVWGATRQRQLSNLIIFEGTGRAEALCAANGWDCRELRLNALSLGLAHRQPSMIEAALRTLDPDQHRPACRMLLALLQTLPPNDDEDFVDKLLATTMSFAAHAIEVRAARPEQEQELLVFQAVLEGLRDYTAEQHDARARRRGAYGMLGAGAVPPFLQRRASLSFLGGGRGPPAEGPRARRSLFRSASSASLDDLPPYDDDVLPPDLAPLGSVPRQPSSSSSLGAPASPQHHLFQLLSYLASPPSSTPPEIAPAAACEEPTEPSGLPEAPLSFGSHHQRWERLEEVEVLRDALLTNKVSTALGFLRDRRRKLAGAYPVEFGGTSAPAELTYPYVKRMASALAYQQLCHEQDEVAVQLLAAVGEDWAGHFKEVAFRTARRGLRQRLLGRLRVGDTAEAAAQQYLQRLEGLLPIPLYSLEWSQRAMAPRVLRLAKYRPALALRPSSAAAGDSDTEGLPDPADLDDLSPAEEARYGFQLAPPPQAGDRPATLLPGHRRFRSGSITDGRLPNRIWIPRPVIYDHDASLLTSSETDTDPRELRRYAHTTLSWTMEWDSETRDRVLVEKKAAAPPAASILHLVACSNWRGVCEWARTQPTATVTVVEPAEAAGEERLASAQDGQVAEALGRVQRAGLPFVIQALREELTRRHVFLPPSLAAAQSLLAATGVLFRQAGHGGEGEQPLAGLQPLGNSTAPLHKHVLRCGLDLGLPERVLQAYIDTYELYGPSLAAVREGTWLHFYATASLRDAAGIFAASLKNAELVLGAGAAATIEMLFRQARPLLAMASLLYAQPSLVQALRPTTSPHRVDPTLLRQWARLYPELERALFGSTSAIERTRPAAGKLNPNTIVSSNGDLTLGELLEDGFPVRLPALTDAETVSHPMFSSAEFDSDRFEEHIDVFYHLSKGRPSQAYIYLQAQPRRGLAGLADAVSQLFPMDKSCLPSPPPSLRLLSASTPTSTPLGSSEGLGLTDDEGRYLAQLVRLVALHDFLDVSVVSACVGLLELCRLPSEELRVDVEAARRIYAHKLAGGPASASVDRERAAVAKETTGLLVHTSSAQMLALSLLEEAQFVGHGGASDEAAGQLVTAFSRVHGQPLSTGHLRELAQQNMWVQFLYEGQLLSIPGDTMHELAGSFTDPKLRAHVRQVVQSLLDEPQRQAQRKAAMAAVDRPGDARHDLFELWRLAVVEGLSASPGTTLLLHAVAHRRPLLAVMAACCRDVAPLEALAAWLAANTLPDSDGGFVGQVHEWLVAKWTRERRLLAAGDDAVPGLLAGLVTALCKARLFYVVRRGLLLFDDSSPFLQFLSFYQAFTQLKFSEAAGHLARFAGWQRSQVRVRGADWVVDAAAALVRYQRERCVKGSEWELAHLLRILAESQFSDEYRSQYRTFTLLRKAGLPVTALVDATPDDIIGRLLDKGLFAEARGFAIENGLTGDKITVEEAHHILRRAQRSSNWESEQERLHVWGRLHALFLASRCSPDVAGSFFYDWASAATDYPSSSAELLVLLTYALGWLNGTYPQEGGPPCRPLPFLKELENKILLLSVGVEASALPADQPAEGSPSATVTDGEPSTPATPTTPSYLQSLTRFLSPSAKKQLSSNLLADLSASSLSASGNERVLDQIIGRLLQAGDVKKAENICAQFRYDSLDLAVVKTAIGLCEKTLAVSDIPPAVAGQVRQAYPSLELVPANAVAIVQALGRVPSGGAEYVRQLACMFSVAHALALSYAAVVARDPYEVLQILLVGGKELLGLSRDFIHHKRLDYMRVAGLLAETFFKAMMELTSYPTAPSSSAGGSSAVGAAALRGVDPTWSATEFAEFVELCKCPYEVGYRLMWLLFRSWGVSAAASGPEEFAVAFSTSPNNPAAHFPQLPPHSAASLAAPTIGEVEVLYRSYQCFQQASHLEASQWVLKTIRGRVDAYVAAGDLRFLVRLLTGTGAYTELVTLFDTLVEYDAFELLLQKSLHVNTADPESYTEFRRALRNYLMSSLPHDLEKLTMVFLAFKMNREMAETLVDHAERKLKQLQFSSKDKGLSKHNASLLLAAMEHYLDAADNFTKEKSFQSASKCLSKAALISLQLKKHTLRVLNMTLDDARKLMSEFESFYEALIIANAYELNSPAEWLGPLYHQVIVRNNTKFYEEFRDTIPVTPTLFVELAQRFKADPERTKHTTNFKQFLTYLSDHFQQYDLAKELGFGDLQAKLLVFTPGLKYWKEPSE